jgi:hypothetical protein
MLARFSHKTSRLALCGAVAWLIVSATSCGNPDSEAVRHLVIAELIQREGIPGSQISVTSVHFPTDGTAIVEVLILQTSTKASTPQRKVQCRLERKEGRWTLVSIGDRS